MAKIQQISEIAQSLPFSEYNFYDLYLRTFTGTELGRMKRLLPLRDMAVSLGLVRNSPLRNRGRKPYFSPEGKVALMFLKMYT